jgi:hypothetical protein
MSRSKEINGERNKSGQFLLGHTGLGGRPKGSRDKLGQVFIEDLYDEWRKSGKDVLSRVVRDEPAQFLKTVAALMPKEIDTTLSIDADLFAKCQSFVEAFRLARQVIGAQISPDDEMVLIERFEARGEE